MGFTRNDYFFPLRCTPFVFVRDQKVSLFVASMYVYKIGVNDSPPCLSISAIYSFIDKGAQSRSFPAGFVTPKP